MSVEQSLRLPGLQVVLKLWHHKTLLLLFWALLLCSSGAWAAQVTLSWNDPNNAAQEVGGYRLYYWQNDWDAPARVAVPPTAIPYTLTGLEAGQTYYFAVTAYDQHRARESPRSNIVRRTIPGLAPMASFRATSATTGPLPLTVNFADTSTGSITSWTWTFGDGGTSTAKNPRHTYTAAGTYAVKLIVWGRYGADTVIRRGYITVSAPATGLVAAYNFNAGRGTTLPDLSGNANHGRISGATWTSQGKVGRALAFDGRNDWVTIADAPSLDLTTRMTLEAWVYPTALRSWQTILLKQQPNHLAYALYANTDTNRPSGHVFIGSDRDTRGTTRLPLNTWTHLAVTYNGATLRLYVNGALASSRTVQGPIPVSAAPLRLGGNSVWGEYFQGRIDEVRIYKRALTAAEIRDDMRTPVTALLADRQSPAVSITTPGRGTTVSRSAVTVAATTLANGRKTAPNRRHAVLLPGSTTAFFEFGDIQADSTWQPLTFRRPFVDPVVLARLASNPGGTPTLVQMRHITPTGFELRLQERESVDRVPAQGTVGYLVVERGQHMLEGAIPIEAGSLVTPHPTRFVTIPFRQAFGVAPVVLTAVASANGQDAVTTRVRNVTPGHFQVRLHKQHKNPQSPVAETITYIAWPPSCGLLADNLAFEVQQTPDVQPYRWHTLTFLESFTAMPVLLADLQTTDGNDPASLRWANRGFFGVDIQIAVERSPEDARQLTAEVVGYLALAVHDPITDSDDDGLTNADEVLRYGTDPADVDTDHDGLDDGQEVQFWGTQWNADPDGDGLSNLLDLDSDDDGILDGEALPCQAEVRPPGRCPR